MTTETRELAAKQFQQAKGDNPMVTCPCGTTAPLRFLFRCLYCGVYFCQSCAEEHFGQTRAEYLASKESNR